MKKYEPDAFISAVRQRMSRGDLPACPYCGGRKYTTTEQLATVLIGDQLDAISIGPSIPSGMVICENCGHIDFFALGALGLLDGVNENG